MHPNFEQLLQIIRTAAQSAKFEFIRVILASPKGDFQFVEVTEKKEFRTELEQAFKDGHLALGLLGWELREEGVQGRSIIFSWHKKDEKLCQLFERLCEMAVDSVRGEAERL